MDKKTYLINDFSYSCLLMDMVKILKSSTGNSKKVKNFANSLLCLVKPEDLTETDTELHNEIFNILKNKGFYNL